MDKRKIKAIRDSIFTAEKSIRTAKKILKEILVEYDISEDEIDLDTWGLHAYASDTSKIIEWLFTGEEMLWADEHIYPIPANYASKSKLVQWDRLKLTIDENGKMMYKQIEPIERETKIWLLTKEWGKFQVLADNKTYNVLTAAVTHFKAEIWDSITVIVPAGKEATFAAIESVIPKE